LDRRQSLVALRSLARNGAMGPDMRWAVGFAAACRWSHAGAANYLRGYRETE